MGDANGVSFDPFDRECKIMDRFTANAKSYIQISSGALLLSVTFLHEIVGVPRDKPVNPGPVLTAAWICFLVAILAGTTSQYLGVKFLEWKSGLPRSHRSIPRWIIQHPWPVYGLMLAGFYSGAILFTVAAIQRFPEAGMNRALLFRTSVPSACQILVAGTGTRSSPRQALMGSDWDAAIEMTHRDREDWNFHGPVISHARPKHGFAHGAVPVGP